MRLAIIIVLLASIVAADLADHNQVYYRFEESASPMVDDVGNSNATCTSCPDFQETGIIGYAAENIAANNDAIITTTDSVWATGTGSFSANMWVKFNTIPFSGGFDLFSDTDGGTPYAYHTLGSGGFLNSGIYTGSSQRIDCESSSSPKNVTDTTSWHMTTFVYNASENLCRVYWDGRDYTTTRTSSGAASNIANNYYGIGNNGGGANRLDGFIDELSFFDYALKPVDIGYLYNSGSPGSAQQYPFGGLIEITNISCTSPTPDDTEAPYATSDVTPTFTFTSNYEAWCRISDEDLGYDSMAHNCSGEGTLSHTCTLHDNDALTGAGTQYVHVACTDGAFPHNVTNNYDLELYILTANETEARAAIEAGINNALPASSVFTDQQIYVIYDDDSQSLVSFDKVAVHGNQYWAFNYVSGDINDSTQSVGTTLYSWINWSLTTDQITSQVQSLIEATVR